MVLGYSGKFGTAQTQTRPLPHGLELGVFAHARQSRSTAGDGPGGTWFGGSSVSCSGPVGRGPASSHSMRCSTMPAPLTADHLEHARAGGETIVRSGCCPCFSCPCEPTPPEGPGGDATMPIGEGDR